VIPRAAPPACVVGAYALAPPDLDELRRLLTQIARLPGVTGFELPLGWITEVGAEPVVRDLPGGGRHVLTLIGAQAREAQRDPRFGLASTDPAGRRRAVELVRTAQREVTALADRGIGVVAVEVHSWPSVDPRLARDGADALTESLIEIAGWSWAGAALVVEHCDARTDEHPGQKRLLPLSAEIAAVRAARAATPQTPVGMSVNWGRSAIEARDPDRPVEHIRELSAADLLAGLIFSGAASLPGVYGAAWSDVHLPLHEDQRESVLDRSAVAASMSAGTPTLFTGVKVAAHPSDVSSARRLELVRTLLDAMRAAPSAAEDPSATAGR
jgi:hypothetical protein